ncbi:MAG TPA: NUDIX hydrolase [Firmicutes bacterium]|nr:NUDIX hydrolase [Bacillota bacterium]
MREKTLTRDYLYRGRIINLRIDQVQLPDGREATREVVEHPGAVAIIALTDREEVVLIKQYRQATGEEMWEIPAGKLEAGEDPRHCASRELAEETGYTATSWEKLTSFYTSPGFASEILHLFLARGLAAGEQALDPDETIHTFLVPLTLALEMIKRGEIRDAKTIVGILLAAWERNRGPAEV